MNLGFKKIAVATAVVAAFVASTGHAANVDLTTFSPAIGASGSVTLTSNYADLTASSSITGAVSNVASFQWFFQAADYLPFNDLAYVSINGIHTTLSDVATVGDYGASGWNTYSFATPFSGSLGFGVANDMDNEQSSKLYIQNVAAVPEPETYAMLLAGLGLIGGAVKRRKAKQA